MKKLTLIISIYALLIIGTIACNQKEKTGATAAVTEESPIQVDLQFTPKEPRAKEKVKLSVTITQKNSPVLDADAVKYEIWQNGQDNHKIVPATKSSNGLYSIEYSFDQPGQYYVMYHVDARGFHNMSKKEISVLSQGN